MSRNRLRICMRLSYDKCQLYRYWGGHFPYKNEEKLKNQFFEKSFKIPLKSLKMGVPPPDVREGDMG